MLCRGVWCRGLRPCWVLESQWMARFCLTRKIANDLLCHSAPLYNWASVEARKTTKCTRSAAARPRSEPRCAKSAALRRILERWSTKSSQLSSDIDGISIRLGNGEYMSLTVDSPCRHGEDFYPTYEVLNCDREKEWG
jgi:hypothetical protein